jgi:RNA polymerase sigma-70 factor (sigma-E family)
VGGEPVNGQSAEAVLDSPEAVAALAGPQAGVLNAKGVGAVLDGQVDGALDGSAVESSIADGVDGSAVDGRETLDGKAALNGRAALDGEAADVAPDTADAAGPEVCGEPRAPDTDAAIEGLPACADLDAEPADDVRYSADTDSDFAETAAEGALGGPAADTALGNGAATEVAGELEAVIALGDMDTQSYPAVETEADGDHGAADTKLAADGEPPDLVARPTNVTETLTATALVPEIRSAPSVWDADRVVTEIYHGEYKSLVRLAVLLVHDVPTAEEVVQDAFEAMHTAWRRLRDSEKALSYLRQAVVNRSRSVLRHRTVVDKNAPKPAPDEPSAEHAAMALIERSAVIEALRTLPDRQREAIVLRYYADLSEADIAATMGISKGAVKSHTARAMAALKSILEQETA